MSGDYFADPQRGNGVFFADIQRYIDDDVFIFITSSTGRRDATEISGDVADVIFR
ncbi:MAG: hypothetical protein MI724_09390 [Spirochaetales bacterium]|nr:hypothetical protein [Spirochaetales bacterium]